MTNPTTALDSSGNHRDLTYVSAQPLSFGVTGPFAGGGGSALQLPNTAPRSGYWATRAPSTDFNLPAFTVGCWMWVGNTPSANCLFVNGHYQGSGPAGLVGWAFGFNYNLGGIQLIYNASNYAISSTTIPTYSAWHHAALTFSGTSVTFYIDGVAAGTSALTFAGSSTAEGQTLGGGYYGTDVGQTFLGQLAGLFVCPSVLSGATIASIAASSNTSATYKSLVQAQSPVGLWMLDEVPVVPPSMSYGDSIYGSMIFYGRTYPMPLSSETVDISNSVIISGDPTVPVAPIVPYEPRWLEVGHALALVPNDNESGDWMFQLLPEWYRTLDENTPGHPTDPAMEGWGQLRRYIEIVGQMYDNLRSEIDTLEAVHNASVMRIDLVKNLAQMMGFPYEPNIGAAPLRALAANWFYILKRKGTYDATLRFVQSITNYPTEIDIGMNMLLTTDDSQGTQSVGFWHSTGNDLITAVQLANPFVSTCTTALACTPVAEATPQPMNYIDADVSSPASIQQTAIPLRDPNIDHYFSIAFRWFDVVTSPSSFVPTLTIDWYTAAGTHTGTSSALGQAFVANAWTVSYFDHVRPVPLPVTTGNEPAGTSAAFAVLGWSMPYPGAGKRLRFTGVSFSDQYPFTDDATPQRIVFTPPKEVQITLYPTRVNYFPNPNFESPVDLYFQSVSAQYTTLQTTETANPLTYATHSMKVILDPLVSSVQITSDPIGPGQPIETPPMVPGDVWSFMVSVYPGQPPGDELLTPFFTLVYPDGSSEQVMVEPQFPNVSYAWTQLICNVEVPVGGLDHIAVGVQIDNAPAAGNSVYYLDSVMVERNTYPYFYGYFDGNIDDTTADFIWAGDENDSASMYFPNRYMRDMRLRELLPDFLPPLCAFDIYYLLPTS